MSKSIISIEMLEREVGCIFPEEYKEFLRKVDGGKLLRKTFDLCSIDPYYATGYCPFEIEIDYLFSRDQLIKVWSYTKEEYRSKKLLPIATVLGGDTLCIGSCDSIEEGAVFFHSYDFEYLKVASSLIEFFDHCD